MHKNKGDIILHIVFIIMAVLCMAPIVLMLAISFTSESDIMEHGYRFIPEGGYNLEAYKYVLTHFGNIITGYANTIFVTIVTTVLDVTLTALYAYPMARKDFPFRKFFSTLVLITLLFGGGLAPSYYVTVRILHLKNTYTVLVLKGLGLGFTCFMMRSYYATNVPYEIIESGKMDGASEWRIFAQLVAPMAVPIYATNALQTAIGCWNSYMTNMLYVEDKDKITLQYVMQKALMEFSYIKGMDETFSSFIDTSVSDVPVEGARMAMAVIAIGPVIFAYPFFQKFFIKGLSVGAVKG